MIVSAERSSSLVASLVAAGERAFVIGEVFEGTGISFTA